MGIEVAQVHNRVPKHRNIGAEGDEGADGNLIAAKNHNACKIKHNGTYAPAEVNGGTEGIVKADCRNERVAVFFYQLPESLLCFAFCMETLDNPNAGKIFMYEGIQIGGFLSVNLPPLVGINLYEPKADCHYGSAAQGGRGQNRVFSKHNDDNGANGNEVRD